MMLIIEKLNIELATDDLYAGKTLQIRDERIGDLVLDLLRRASRPVGEDDHLVLGQVWNGVDRRVDQRPVTPKGCEAEQHDHDPAVPER